MMNEETVTVILARDERITTVRVELLKRDIQELEMGGLGSQWVIERED